MRFRLSVLNNIPASVGKTELQHAFQGLTGFEK